MDPNYYTGAFPLTKQAQRSYNREQERGAEAELAANITRAYTLNYEMGEFTSTQATRAASPDYQPDPAPPTYALASPPWSHQPIIIDDDDMVILQPEQVRTPEEPQPYIPIGPAPVEFIWKEDCGCFPALNWFWHEETPEGYQLDVRVMTNPQIWVERQLREQKEEEEAQRKNTEFWARVAEEEERETRRQKKGNCTHCGKSGHRKEKCWKKKKHYQRKEAEPRSRTEEAKKWHRGFLEVEAKRAKHYEREWGKAWEYWVGKIDEQQDDTIGEYY